MGGAAAIFSMNGYAQVPAHQGLTFNGDGVLRNNQIQWPKEFEPKQADQQPNAMHEGHQLWLTALKNRSEKH
jgi:hypothetical protein